jgi:hypothetical protein
VFKKTGDLNMSDLNEKLAQEAAELINGGEWHDGKWYSDGQRDAWRRALKPAADRIENLEAALRWICGSRTIEYFDGTVQADETKMLWTYRRIAREALEGIYDERIFKDPT